MTRSDASKWFLSFVIAAALVYVSRWVIQNGFSQYMIDALFWGAVVTFVAWQIRPALNK